MVVVRVDLNMGFEFLTASPVQALEQATDTAAGKTETAESGVVHLTFQR